MIGLGIRHMHHQRANLGLKLVFISPRRFLSTTYAYISDQKTLFTKIDTEIAANNCSSQSILEAIKACLELRKSLFNKSKLDPEGHLNTIDSKIIALLSQEPTDFLNDLLKLVLLLKFPPSTNVQILEAFYQKNPTQYIQKDTALIALRSSLFDADLNLALKITDLTVGHKNYISHKNSELKSGSLRLIGTTLGTAVIANIGIKVGIESGVVSEAWASMSSIYAMVFTYIMNSSFFAAVVKFGRIVISGGGDYLTWQKGVFYGHWWRHADELLFCLKIVETDVSMNGTGSASQELIEELCRTDETLNSGRTLKPGYTRLGKKVRLMAPKDNLNEIMLQAYWMTGGDGFEWVEPDQDPAEILWKQHMEQFERGGLDGNDRKAIGWADDLIESEKRLL